MLDDKIEGEPDNTPGIASKGPRQDLYKDAQKGAPEVALKAAIQVTLGLHLLIQLLVHKSVQNDSKMMKLTGQSVPLERTSRILF